MNRDEETVRSEGVGQFCGRLHDKLNRIERRINDLQAKVRSDGKAAKKEIDEGVDVAKAALRRVQDDAFAARARMEEHLQEKKAETEEAIAQWKRSRKVDKLARRAEDAEAYAAWSVLVAVEAIDEADLATMQAIGARLDLELTAENRSGHERDDRVG